MGHRAAVLGEGGEALDEGRLRRRADAARVGPAGRSRPVARTSPAPMRGAEKGEWRDVSRRRRKPLGRNRIAVLFCSGTFVGICRTRS